jgi:hypothetical protein
MNDHLPTALEMRLDLAANVHASLRAIEVGELNGSAADAVPKTAQGRVDTALDDLFQGLGHLNATGSDLYVHGGFLLVGSGIRDQGAETHVSRTQVSPA